MRLVWGTVSTVEPAVAQDVQTLVVELDEGAPGRAVSYTSLSGTCVIGDRVLLNTTAVDLALGTGGVHFVVARMGEGSGAAFDDPSGGHIMKLRYTPLQCRVCAAEEEASPYHDILREATNGRPFAPKTSDE